ncbi:MAG: hypothetical protein QW751_01630 [Candidatus Aenigmatarchaeota archaeon]
MRKGIIWTTYDIIIVLIVLAILGGAIAFVLWPNILEAVSKFSGLWGK